MTRDDLVDEAVRALAPVKEILDRDRVGLDSQVKPLIIQFALEYAKILSLAALSYGGHPVAAEVLDLVSGTNVPPAAAPQPPNGSGLVIPG